MDKISRTTPKRAHPPEYKPGELEGALLKRGLYFSFALKARGIIRERALIARVRMSRCVHQNDG